MSSDDNIDCPACGYTNVKPAEDKPEEYFCPECEAIFDTETDSYRLERKNEKDSSQGGIDSERWSERTEPAIVAFIEEPNGTYQEYYRIENPKEFFEDCSGEQDERERIKQSDLEPIQTVDFPYINWRFQF